MRNCITSDAALPGGSSFDRRLLCICTQPPGSRHACCRCSAYAGTCAVKKALIDYACLCTLGSTLQVHTGPSEKELMLIPIRCYTCGSVTAAATLQFLRAKCKADKASALEQAGDRTCCRRMVLGTVHSEALSLSYEGVTSHMSSAACEVPHEPSTDSHITFGR
jgi:DNA-directed RNA polymerase subunit N (RpoN/RPB10)